MYRRGEHARASRQRPFYTAMLYTLVMDCLFISQKETDLFIVVWKWFI